ncbi:Uncharacterized protein T08_4473 [Trichinella sp. T8]|nr:Uncharacterized protein T08_4473 [Trichinella sp. T8]
MKNEEIKLRLLAKENIKLVEALSFLEMYEEIHGCISRATMQECHAVQEMRGLKPRGVLGVCHCCGEAGHIASKNFQGPKCFKCGKQGHLAKVCKHPQKLEKSQKQGPQNSWKDHKLYADGIYAVKERAHNFEVTVKINGKSTRMELDTGAAVTIVTPECWKSIGSLKLKRATMMLRSFTGHEVNLKGETMVTDGGVPVFRIPFPLAFTMHDAVEKELERYVDMGLNDRLMDESYPILRPEDLYQALRGGKTFTKLDNT